MAVKLRLSDLPSGLRDQAIKQINAQQKPTGELPDELLKKDQEKDPQFILTRAVKNIWADVEIEYNPRIKGRKFSIDLAFPKQMLAVECDGWQYHAKYKKSFQIDRERQNVLVVNGWRVLRFVYKDIMREESRSHILDMIREALANTSSNT